jgi:Zn-dependent M28 family amino/carboxypeptidase
MEQRLRDIVTRLSVPGLRNAGGPRWEEAMEMVHDLVAACGKAPAVQRWRDSRGREYRNYSLVFPGRSARKIVVGAHYDTFEITPGADDNASAVAVLWGVAHDLMALSEQLPYTVELVWYACEEPPFFGTDGMGSHHHALACDKALTKLMICLEMVGFYSDDANSQDYPLPLLKYWYGTIGNYLMLVSNVKSYPAMRGFAKSVQGKSDIPYKQLVSPFRAGGLDWSDHRSYWACGIPAFMITDTALFRNQHYHAATDTPETLDYLKMGKLVGDLCHYLSTIPLK